MRREYSWPNFCALTAVTKLWADSSMLGNCTSRTTEPTSESVLQLERWTCISWRPWESWLECASDNHEFVTIPTAASHLKYRGFDLAKRHLTAGTGDGLFVNTAIKLRVPQNAGHLNSSATIRFWRRILPHEANSQTWTSLLTGALSFTTIRRYQNSKTVFFYQTNWMHKKHTTVHLLQWLCLFAFWMLYPIAIYAT
jgi:hypothetical protein